MADTKQTEKPKTTRVSNPVSVAIHKIATVLDALSERDRGIVLATIEGMYRKAEA